jgi:cob(I)alamin adenosyltransferase
MDLPETAPPMHPGDDGTTAVPGMDRVGKSAPVVDALGTLDELNAALGLLRTALDERMDERIEGIQRDVLAIGAELATGRPGLGLTAVAALERESAQLSSRLPPVHTFFLPGANEASARANWARTICRRAERAVVRLHESHPDRVTPAALAFLNRLSDWLFALARAQAHPA